METNKECIYCHAMAVYTRTWTDKDGLGHELDFCDACGMEQ